MRCIRGLSPWSLSSSSHFLVVSVGIERLVCVRGRRLLGVRLDLLLRVAVFRPCREPWLTRQVLLHGRHQLIYISQFGLGLGDFVWVLLDGIQVLQSGQRQSLNVAGNQVESLLLLGVLVELLSYG